MSDITESHAHGDAINDAMVEAMNQRRLQRQDRRRLAGRPAAMERRKTCAYCFQPGDHATPAACLRALER
jgi:hypothetical protein